MGHAHRLQHMILKVIDKCEVPAEHGAGWGMCGKRSPHASALSHGELNGQGRRDLELGSEAILHYAQECISR